MKFYGFRQPVQPSHHTPRNAFFLASFSLLGILPREMLLENAGKTRGKYGEILWLTKPYGIPWDTIKYHIFRPQWFVQLVVGAFTFPPSTGMQWIFVNAIPAPRGWAATFPIWLTPSGSHTHVRCMVQLLHLEVIIRSSCMIWIKTHYGTETTTNEFPIATFDWFEEGSN